ncbi:MAG TPA: hypothetical protein V6D19_13660 [Stenomitos sp.]
MLKRSSKIGLFASACILVNTLTPVVLAACKQTDAAGKWNIYLSVEELRQIDSDPIFVSGIASLFCKNLSIGNTGKISSGSICNANKPDPGVITLSVSGGTLLFDKSTCQAKGELKLKSGVESGTFKISNVTFGLDKSFFSGFGRGIEAAIPGSLRTNRFSIYGVKL